MIFVIIVWALAFARLTYSFIGWVAPETFKVGSVTVFIAFPSIFIGAWLGAMVYNNWPVSHRSGGETASLLLTALSALMALPFFFLFWRLLVYAPSYILVLCLFVTIFPCAVKWLMAWLEREEEELSELDLADRMNR